MHRLVLVLACLAASVGSAYPTGYENFYRAFATNDIAKLKAMSIASPNPEDPEDNWLRGVAKATILLRSGAIAQCILSLDSLEHSTGRTGPLGEGWLHKLRALALQEIGGHTQALRAINTSLSLHLRISHPYEHADQLIIRSEVQRALGDHARALEDLREAAAIADSLHYTRAHGMIEIGLGNLSFEREEYPEALQHFEKCFRIASASGYTLLMNNALSNLGSVALMTNDEERALRIYHEVLNSFGSANPLQRSDIYDQIGYVRRETGRYDLALNYFDRALAIKDSLHDARGKPQVMLHKATALWMSKEREKAIDLLNSTIHLARQYGLDQVELESRSSLAYYYTLQHEFAAAYEQKDAEMWLSDSLLRKRFSDQVSASKVLFDTERKERRIAEQEQSLKLSAVEGRRRSMQRNVLVGSSAVLALIAFLLYRAMHNRQRLAQKEKELHHEQVDQLLSQQEIKSINAMLEGQEKERDRVAKDLHDRLGSMLGGIKVQLGALEDRVEQVQQEAQFKKVNRLLDETVGELRQISHDMAASTLSRFGLEKALKDLRETIHISGRLSVELSVFGLEQRLERSVEIAVYRIVQELVSNVLKHAKASELSIDVTRSPGRLSVIVSDNGIGFDPAKPAEGMGLNNVRSRAASLGATVQVDSTPGKGTTVSVECPVVE